MTVRAVLYARVCVDDGHNLVEQLAACRAHAQEQGLDVVAELAEQGAGSGSSCLPELDRVLQLAQAGAFDVLVARDPYRLTRELNRLLSLEAQFAQHGVGLEYCMPGDLNVLPGDQDVLASLVQVRVSRQPEKPGMGG